MPAEASIQNLWDCCKLNLEALTTKNDRETLIYYL